MKYSSGTGYDLAKAFEASLNTFWHAQPSQIYRELNRMEEKGWISSCCVIQEKRPNKRVYSLTEKGESELKKWLSADLPPSENPHNPILLRIFFGVNASDSTLELLKSYKDQMVSSQELLKNTFKTIEYYASVIPDGNNSMLYWEMTLKFGLYKIRAAIQWAEECIANMEVKCDNPS